jgi:hypothetical protein
MACYRVTFTFNFTFTYAGSWILHDIQVYDISERFQTIRIIW